MLCCYYLSAICLCMSNCRIFIFNQAIVLIIFKEFILGLIGTLNGVAE
jgi:hypothetical protein